MNSKNHNTAFHHLKKRFSKRHEQAVKKVSSSSPAVQNIIHKVKEKAGSQVNKTAATMMSSISTGLLAGSLFLSPAPVHAELAEVKTLGSGNSIISIPTPIPMTLSKLGLSHIVSRVLPSKVQNPDKDQNQEIERILSEGLGIKVRSQLDGKMLNTTYGYMGAEQHLPRFPGDKVENHDFNQKSGITSHTGAWGYFASSESQMSQDAVDKEKYYFAVQSFMAPGWNENAYQLKEWFKHRKMVAVNPKTGDAVVGVIADAGPALWTRKQFGGSPEAMADLHLNSGMQNGAVLLYFVDDPDNKIPLGPVKLR